MAYNADKIKNNYDLFLKQYARKGGKNAKSGHGLNDRRYDRKLEKIIKKMKPEKLYDILSEEDFKKNSFKTSVQPSLRA